MMTSKQIRQAFLDFFASKQHKIVPSAPLVNKNDPTLMFTNAGMNQFKDFFLGNQVPDNRRIADTQKCLRVSGKHNDLEDVGMDGTHHTMFEMLGNWSFGDYFKQDALDWSWEFLTAALGMQKDRLYATVFEGDAKEGLPADDEARKIWLNHLPEQNVLYGNKKDNFWEMGDTGPCGPCSEIHFDTRSDAERAAVPGYTLVNVDGSGVVEIWNNVFIQFNRKADGSLESLPEKHVDTGMGFERLCMVLQEKKATYDTDIFTPFIQYIESISGIKYTGSYEPTAKTDIAMRVISDHIRAVAFAIADGQLPGSGGAGYVIRRILRRAVRYYYSFLGIKAPFLHTLIPMLSQAFDGVFPELKAQEKQVARIIESEETSFLNTLENGLKRFDTITPVDGIISGKDAFLLFDTYGFPIDLTRLIASEKGIQIDEAGFEAALQEQKSRGRADAQKEVGDWVEVHGEEESVFVGYDFLEVINTSIIKMRTVKVKQQDQYQVVLSQTPFYGRSGGQTGDTGFLSTDAETIRVLDTVKENDLIVHIVDKLPVDAQAGFTATVDAIRRQEVSAHHSAVHLMHAALHRVLGSHATQKGQDVDDQRLRFDFSHFQKMTDEELQLVEAMVNEKIRANIALQEDRNMPIEQAAAGGAMMLFGEKYGETVRVITFEDSYSKELCGGTHVKATGEIGYFKIVAESAVAAGIRRLEAVVSRAAQQAVLEQSQAMASIKELLKNPRDLVKSITDLQDENKQLRKEIEQLMLAQANALKAGLISEAVSVSGKKVLVAEIPVNDGNAVKNLMTQLEQALAPAVIVLGSAAQGKPMLTVAVSQALTQEFHAGNMVRELARFIEGGGGGQPFFASAGGKNPAGLPDALAKAKEITGLT